MSSSSSSLESNSSFPSSYTIFIKCSHLFESFLKFELSISKNISRYYFLILLTINTIGISAITPIITQPILQKNTIELDSLLDFYVLSSNSLTNRFDD